MMSENEYTEIVKNMRTRTTRMEHEGDYWSEEERRKLVALFETGVGITQIAVQLQRTEPAVIQQIEKLDLYRRKEKPSRNRSTPKTPTCLCEACTLYKADCTRCEGCIALQEGR